MKPLGIKNVSINISEYADEAAVGGVYGDSRYHFWTNRTLTNHKPILYRNPAPGVPHFRTRKGRINSGLGARIVAELLAIVERDGLLEKERAAITAAAEVKARERAEYERIERAKEAGPELLAALQRLVALEPFRDDDDRELIEARNAARTAIAKAEGK